MYIYRLTDGLGWGELIVYNAYIAGDRPKFTGISGSNPNLKIRQQSRNHCVNNIPKMDGESCCQGRFRGDMSPDTRGIMDRESTQLDLVSCQACHQRSHCQSSASKKRCRLPWTVSLVVMVTYCLLTLATPSLAIQQIQVDDEMNDIKNFLTVLEDSDVDVSNDKDNVVAKQPVSVKWGIPDTTAFVGKLFHYMLPKDAFRGDITEYKVCFHQIIFVTLKCF